MPPLKAIKRIMIFGLPGSGKSTFAVYLEQLLRGASLSAWMF
jgi:adenylate kinase family enzyme